MLELIKATPTGLWCISAALCALIAMEHGWAKALAVSLISWCAYYLLWTCTPQLGGWQVWFLYTGINLLGAVNRALVSDRKS